MKPTRHTVYIDCTATYHLGTNTGIQRVVRNIVKRATRTSGRSHVRCVPVVAKYGQFWQAGDFDALHVSSVSQTAAPRKPHAIAARLDAHEKAVLGHCARFKGLLVYAYGVSALRRSLRYWGCTVRQLPFARAWLTGRMKRVRPIPGDILLMPDAFWAYDVISPLFKRSYSAWSVIPMIHDLIPLTHPEYCDARFTHGFRELLPRLCRVADAFICISHATQRRLQTYLSDAGMTRQQALPMAVWYSGSDLSSEPDAEIDRLPLRQAVRETPAPGTRFLMVGTLEPRKGYDYVFDAFTSFWNDGGTDSLIIVGRVDSLCEPLLQRMRQSPNHGRFLFVFTDANDRELSHLYRNAHALIFASRVEGFGLPLVEAMQNGLRVIASDIDVFREIGGDHLTYFTAGDANALKQTLVDFAPNDPGASTGSWHTWDEAATELIASAVRLSASDASRVLNDAPIGGTSWSGASIARGSLPRGPDGGH